MCAVYSITTALEIIRCFQTSALRWAGYLRWRRERDWLVSALRPLQPNSPYLPLLPPFQFRFLSKPRLSFVLLIQRSGTAFLSSLLSGPRV